ncbi:MAG: AAA family ATPase, partial [Gammaproteobacteria bacterium]
MNISKLTAENIRNIASVSIEPGEKFNIIVGKNGSGKTSLLEAIYILGAGRSFRSRKNTQLISFEKPQLTVFAKINDGSSLGVEKHRNGENRIRINAENKNTVAALAQML